ncbi:MAG: ATP-binding cassette domain-containing protein [Chitinivibrionales bacterium]|nr:ATP-binding cassette domain-containing protein [Chitinivibrionales bacterium]
MIHFDNVVFAREQRTILDRISFAVAFNERVAILGGSGEGKTTILKLIIGLELPDSGEITVAGESLAGSSERRLQVLRRKFGVVFQEGALFDSLSVGENVAFPLREAGVHDPVRLEEKVRGLLRKVGIEHAIGYMPEELSGGMRRRTAIARALATEQSKIFLYDEPTADLDPVNAAIIRDLINNLSGDGRGFIEVTHSVPDALRTARRFLFIQNGSILLDGDARQLKSTGNKSVKDFVRKAL